MPKEEGRLSLQRVLCQRWSILWKALKDMDFGRLRNWMDGHHGWAPGTDTAGLLLHSHDVEGCNKTKWQGKCAGNWGQEGAAEETMQLTRLFPEHFPSPF